MDIMEALVGPVHSATGESVAECGEDGNELKQEEDSTYLDPGLLSYIDKLCSQEDFVTMVGRLGLEPGVYKMPGHGTLSTQDLGSAQADGT